MIAMIDFKREIALAVEKAVPELKLEEALRFLEQPPDRKLGDFALPCFKFSPLLKKSPQEIALELEKKILLPKNYISFSSSINHLQLSSLIIASGVTQFIIV